MATYALIVVFSGVPFHCNSSRSIVVYKIIAVAFAIVLILVLALVSSSALGFALSNSCLLCLECVSSSQVKCGLIHFVLFAYSFGLMSEWAAAMGAMMASEFHAMVGMSEPEKRSSYRKLALQAHPDKNPSCLVFL